MLTSLNNLPKKILFLCTGNYYRSRFAEELFNLKAAKLNIPYVADSAALALERGRENYGPISWYTIDGLETRGIKLGDDIRHPKAVTPEDLESAFLIIAMDKLEHHPIVTERHPDWIERMTFWDVADIDLVEPPEALAKIERLVDALVKTLSR